MTDIKLPSSAPSSPDDDDDNFERDLQEMLDDGPSINEVTSNVQGGTPNSVSASFAEQVGPFSAGSNPAGITSTSGSAGIYGSSSSGARLTRSYTVPPASTSVPLYGSGNSGSSSTGNSPNGDFIPKSVSLVAHNKIEIIKEWSLNTYKTTRQFISERFGRGSRTVDLEMEANIESLRDIQRKYTSILRMARAMASHFYNVVQTQRALGESFSELAQKSPELQEEFLFNCETQRTLVKNGETLLGISVVCFNTRLGFLDPKARENKESARILQASQDVFVDLHKAFSQVAHKWFRSKTYRSYEENKMLLRKQTLQHIKDAQLVLETRKQNGTLDPDEPNLLLYLLSDSSLDFMDIVGIMDSFYIAGTDSTGKNLQTLFYNLAKNLDKQEKLRKEIRNVLGDDELVTGESLAKLPYLKACLKESFRLFYPTLTGTQRHLSTDVVLSGYTVPAGTLIALHNPRTCQKYFSDPDKFIPERWIRSSDGQHTEDIPPTALLPFGSGARNCIGRRFAEQEIYLATIKVLQKLKIEIDSDSWNANFIYTIFIQPEKPINFKFTPIDG